MKDNQQTTSNLAAAKNGSAARVAANQKVGPQKPSDLGFLRGW
jgi:hypothetical protein